MYADQVAALGSTPKALAVSPRNPATAIAITAKAMVVLDAGKVSATVPLSSPASSVSISPDGVTVAVGCENNKANVSIVPLHSPSLPLILPPSGPHLHPRRWPCPQTHR